MSISILLRRFLFLLFMAGLLVVFPMACDPVGSSSPGSAPDSLRISLLDAEKVVTGFSGSKSLRARSVQSLLEETGGRTKAEPSHNLDSRYACTISLYRPDGPQGAGYYFRSATFSFPDSVLARAGGEAVPVRGRISASGVPHPSAINALLRCRLPAVEEATLPVRRFFRFGPKQLGSTGDGATAAQTSGSEGSMSGLGQPSETSGGEAVTLSASCSGEAVVSVGGTVVSSEPYDNCPSASDGGGIGLWEGGGLSTEDGYNVRTLDATDVSGGGSSDPDPEPDDPCASDNPPDYCDEAGSCYDADISDDEHKKILKALEDQRALTSLWKDSNFDQSESERQEQGGFLVPNSYNDGYTFQRLQSSQITQQTPCRLGFRVPSDLPGGTIYVHTHPYTDGERQNACPTSPKYDNEVGVADRPALQQMNLNQGLIIDADKTIFYQASGNDSDGAASYDRCGY